MNARALSFDAPARGPVMLALCTLAGCGLQHSQETDGAPDGSAGVDGAAATACPAAQPTPGDPCSTSLDGLSCEFGTDPDLACNALLECSGGRWVVSTLATNAQEPGCPTARDPSCPASESQVPRGQSCSAAMTCGYADGICDCMIPPLPAVGSLTWFCNAADTTCPSVRPRVGDSCTSGGQTCNYGACTLPQGVALQCDGGTWQPTDIPCPL
jgi:hypothetical protein